MKTTAQAYVTHKKHSVKDLDQCDSPPCDYCKIFCNARTGENHYFCTKLEKSVGRFDACRYHNDSVFRSFMEDDSVFRTGSSRDLYEQEDTEGHGSGLLLVGILLLLLFFL